MNEVWKDIDGYEGLYQVSNLEWCTYKYNNEYNNRVEKCKRKIAKTLAG